MPYRDDDISGKIARIEAKQDSIAESLSRHERWITAHDDWANGAKDDIYRSLDKARREVTERIEKVETSFDVSVEKLSGEIGSLKTRVFGAALAVGIIVSIINIVGVAVAVYAAIGGK